MSCLDSSIIKNKCQLYGLVTLRVLIGWHFLYEGVSKLINPYWSSAAYLRLKGAVLRISRNHCF